MTPEHQELVRILNELKVINSRILFVAGLLGSILGYLFARGG